MQPTYIAKIYYCGWAQLTRFPVFAWKMLEEKLSKKISFSFSSTFIIRSQSHDIINITIVMAKHTYRLIRGTIDLNHPGRLRPKKKLVLSAKLLISGIKTC